MYVGENGYCEKKHGSDLFVLVSRFFGFGSRLSEYLRRDTAEINRSETNVQRVNFRETER
jgi:hypothetical protein